MVRKCDIMIVEDKRICGRNISENEHMISRAIDDRTYIHTLAIVLMASNSVLNRKHPAA
jgi:hypothetical protein